MRRRLDEMRMIDPDAACHAPTTSSAFADRSRLNRS
jgi:hypothetical protein